MPRFISKDGVWHPEKEKIALKNISDETIVNPSTEGKNVGEEVAPGDDFIYEGPDRAALFELFKAKVETLGQDFHHDMDLIQRVRNLGFKDVKSYAKLVGYDKEKVEEEFEKKASIVNKHELPKRVKAIDSLAGGRDTSGGGQDRVGGFGEQPKE